MRNWRKSVRSRIRLAGRVAPLLVLALIPLSTNVMAACGDVFSTLRPGEWYEVPNSQLESNGVAPNPLPPGYTGVRSVMEAWSGGAFDTRRDQLIIWGGGHSDYAGNEVYTFDVNSCTWSRVWGPTPNSQIPSGSTCLEAYPDGSPASRHTYDGLVYIPTTDRFWGQGGSLWCGGGAPGLATWEFDLKARTWSRKSNAPQEHLGVTSAFDPRSQKVYARIYNTFSEYDPANGSWRVRSNEPSYGAVSDSNVAAVDALNHLFVEVGNAQWEGPNYTGVRVWSLDNFSYREPRTNGPASILDGKPGVTYDATLQKIVAYAGGTSVYSLDTSKWAWTEHPAASTNKVTPRQPGRHGIYGRFQYIPSKNGYLFVNSTTENVYFYKLSEGNGTQDPAMIPSPPEDLKAQ